MTKIITNKSIIINLIDDKLMRKLNRKYRGINKTTDVLSFEIGEGGVLGEVYISYPKAKRQAKEYDCSVGEELSRLAGHGILHILGYKHKEMPTFVRCWRTSAGKGKYGA